MPTSPARTPLKVMEGSGLPNFAHMVSMAARPPAQAERQVFAAMNPMLPSGAVVEPQLKPNHANHRMNTPRPAMGMLWPGMARAMPSALYLPIRGPMTTAPARAIQPPTECTTVEPAKSMKPRSSSQPPPPPNRPLHAQCPLTG